MGKLKLGVLISGRGSNLQSLIDACANAAFPAEIACVISNVPGAAGLGRAGAAGIPATIIDHKEFSSGEDFEAAVDAALDAANVELVCLAGFMRLLSDGFAARRRDRLINIHPSLLPAFKGLHVHERVIEAGARFSGCTVHFVRAAMDSGPIIIQAAVAVQADDGPDALADRVLAEEHRIYPLAVRMIAEGRVRVAGEKVTISGCRSPDGALINPAE
jgi:phosphoribosylglycinamide formyltransferase-1